MNVYDLIESCHTRQELDSIRIDVVYVIESCDTVEEKCRIQAAFVKQKNRIRSGRYKNRSDR